LTASRGTEAAEGKGIMERILKSGARVIFFDSLRQPHEALVTIFHGAPEGSTEEEFKAKYHCDGPPCVNLLYVDADESKTDSYGRQTARSTSCTNGDSQAPKRAGNYWLWPDQV
jgi:hypothetical protein